MTVDLCEYHVPVEGMRWWIGISSLAPDSHPDQRLAFVLAMMCFWVWAERDNEAELLPAWVEGDRALDPWRWHFELARQDALEALHRIDDSWSLDDVISRSPCVENNAFVLNPFLHMDLPGVDDA